jgi:hypothetical protein
VLQGQVRGLTLWIGYGWDGYLWGKGTGVENPSETIGYLWEGYLREYGNKVLTSAYGDDQPWCCYLPLDHSWNYCPHGR